MKVAGQAEFVQDASLSDVDLLYVEDDRDAREALSALLARRVGRVSTAEDGVTGLAAFMAERPMVVITDALMPNMDGCAMCREIRAIDAEIPIIMISAHNESEHLLASIELGVFRYLVKPIQPAELFKSVSAAADQVRKRQGVHNELRKVQLALDSITHDSAMLQDYVVQSMVGDLGEFANIRLHNTPKDAVSGDFFCAARHGEDLYLLLADASGHGFSAMVPAMGIPRRFRDQAARGCSLLAIAEDINALLRHQALTGHFVAATLARLTTAGLEVLNCGNPPALLVDGTGALLHEFRSRTYALGMADGAEMYADVERFELDGRASLYLFTDGLEDTLGQVHIDHDDLRKLFMSADGTFDQVVRLAGDALLLGQPDDVTVAEIILDRHMLPGFALDGRERDSPRRWPGAPGRELQVSPDNISVLLVDDDDDSRDCLARTLGRHFGLVYTARSGLEGLRLFGDHQPGVVVTDIRMTGMDGIRMVEALRQLNVDVPIIVTSGAAGQAQAETMFELGVTRFMQKPVDVQKLIKSIIDCAGVYRDSCDMRLSASVLEASPLGITITSRNCEIIAVNSAFSRVTGYSRDEVLGRNPRVLQSGKHDVLFYQGMWQSINETGEWAGEIWNRRKNGELYLEWLSIAAIRDGAGRLENYIAVFSDMTERNLADERLRHLIQYDSLTDLPNRILLHDRLRQALLNAQRDKELVALMFLDLDHFKNINDVLGHEAGDGVLRMVAQRLSSCVRDVDTVSRLGGDEFAILLPDCGSREMVSKIAAKVLSSFSESCLIGQQELRVTTSIGISLFPSDGDHAEALIQHADAAMYLAKKKGRNDFSFFDASLTPRAERHIAIQHGLHAALEHGEFFMMYQPKFSLSRDCVIGAEALIRWNSPRLGEVSPAEFIPIAEETGFIVTLSEWVISAVCDQLVAWQHEGLTRVPVAVNISPLHFQRGNVIQTLEYMLKSRGLDRRLLRVELTEGVVMKHSEENFATLSALQDLGFHVSIDDFGTGFSSLSYLLRLPINEIKIDRSFVSEIAYGGERTDGRTTAIPGAIIGLALKLGLDVVAEGVETLEQKCFLMDHGCDIVQGFLFSRPLDSENFARLLTRGQGLMN